MRISDWSSDVCSSDLTRLSDLLQKRGRGLRPPQASGLANRGATKGINSMKIMSGNSNLPLARAVAAYLEIPLTDASVRRFADEEVFVEIHENVRGEDVFVIQPTSFPVNDNLKIGSASCRERVCQ